MADKLARRHILILLHRYALKCDGVTTLTELLGLQQLYYNSRCYGFLGFNFKRQIVLKRIISATRVIRLYGLISGLAGGAVG